MDMYKNIKHSCTFADLRHLCVRDSLLCVFICSKISINSNGWLGHLIGSVNCDVTGPLWRHQKAVSCLGWDKSISDTRRLSRTPRCTRQNDSRHGGTSSGIVLPPFVAGIDLPHQGVVDSYNPLFYSLEEQQKPMVPDRCIQILCWVSSRPQRVNPSQWFHMSVTASQITSIIWWTICSHQ